MRYSERMVVIQCAKCLKWLSVRKGTAEDALAKCPSCGSFTPLPGP